VVERGLFATASLWEPLERAQSWLARAARVLANEEGADGATVELAYRDVLEEVLRHQSDAGVGAWATEFYKVTRSYWRGLFHCYDVPDVPRTNNDLEHYFGTARHQERRATGQKRPTSAVAVRGSVRVVAAVAARQRRWNGEDLRPSAIEAWRKLRAALEARHETRRQYRRFRRDPQTYLADLETRLLRQGLPV
jgi:hypothetical protein